MLQLGSERRLLDVGYHLKELPLNEDQIEHAECKKCGPMYKCDFITRLGSRPH